MKIYLQHPITYDHIYFDRGVHYFPDVLAERFLAEAPHAASLFAEEVDNPAWGRVSLSSGSKTEAQQKILLRIKAFMDVGEENSKEVEILRWQLHCVSTESSIQATVLTAAIEPSAVGAVADSTQSVQAESQLENIYCAGSVTFDSVTRRLVIESEEPITVTIQQAKLFVALFKLGAHKEAVPAPFLLSQAGINARIGNTKVSV